MAAVQAREGFDARADNIAKSRKRRYASARGPYSGKEDCAGKGAVPHLSLDASSSRYRP